MIVKRIIFITLMLAVGFGAYCQHTARWNPETTDWSKNRHPQIGDWGFDRPGYPKGLYIHGVTVKEGKKVHNAVIYDNDVYDDVFDDEWMFAMASLGLMNLKGQIITPVLTDFWTFKHPEWPQTGYDAYRLAQESGMDMKRIPPIAIGTEAENEADGEGKISEAAKMYVEIINNEYKKHPNLPVIINIGGQAATLASAYCIDPGIVDKCIVYYTDILNYNGHYEWASKLVARHFRVINWGADQHWWKEKKEGQNHWNVLPRPENKMGKDNAADSGEWKLLHDMHVPILNNMIYGMQNRHEFSESFADGYLDGTFIHAWLPGIFKKAELRQLRGEGTEGIHITGFDEECEVLVKNFTLSILLNRKAYGNFTSFL